MTILDLLRRRMRPSLRAASPASVRHQYGATVHATPERAARETARRPTEGQRKAGNYRKGRFRWRGLVVSIENPRGSIRSGKDRDGKPWAVRMQSHYGYFGGHPKGADGDQVDVFVGPDLDSPVVHVVDQVDPQTGRFDEHKVMAGYRDHGSAARAYQANYATGWRGLGGITAVSIDQFKRWLREGDRSKPFSVTSRRQLYSAATTVRNKGPGVRHAPKGGASVGGQHFRGGEFIPGEVLARATPAERKALDARSGADEGQGKGESHGPAPARGREFPRLAQHPTTGPSKPAVPAKAKQKIKAVQVGELVPARREGKGKEARIVLADGSPAPPHVKAAMIPPDWTDVTVATDPASEVIAKARDKAGRIKTVYRDDFHMKTAAAKFSRIREMMAKAPAIHDQNQANRSNPALRDAADCTWLIEEQATRPGSDSDTGARVKAYGATTLRGEHVVQAEDGVRLQFIGKEGVAHDHLIRNPELAEMLIDRKRTAGERGGKLFDTDEKRLNKYISTLDGGSFTAKDFRTLKATRLATGAIREIGECCATAKEYKAKVKEVAQRVSHVLGNKPAQALESYIDPTVFSVWKEGTGG